MDGTLRVNGRQTKISFDPGARLLDVLRDSGHTEVKNGCGEGACGACVVLLDGALVNSCQVLAASAMGREVTTAAGLGTPDRPHPVQAAFAEAGAVQCGFCTPGMVMAAWALLKENPTPTEGEIRRALDGNLCRCTGYVKIVAAVKLASERMTGHG
jgi:carbon-monoxide dehydrogenase small subunit